jgi:hypothetical protein
MPLPKVKQKWYKTKILSDGKEIRMRPFTIGEQKQIMLTKGTTDGTPENTVETYKSIMTLLQTCTEGVDIKKLFIVDFEKMFFDLRSISEGNKVYFEMGCNNVIGTEEVNGKTENVLCGTKSPQEIDTQKELVLINNKFTFDAVVDEGVIAKFRMPNMEKMLMIESTPYKNEQEKISDSIVHCLDHVVEGEKVITNFTHEEATEFVESIPQDCLKEMIKFFKNPPALECTKEFMCPKCGHTRKLGVEEIKSFLA